MMRKFLSCGLIASVAMVATSLQVSAEPPPATTVIISSGTTVVCTETCARSKK